ncbi:MAG: methylated-DNA--[protein]-cysteine S-methyltransferase [Anaerolineae bacterium]|nr:methylated-DNA--[protein]-cysteine S-methyltransferase [Anaerolineae bacterium]
MKGAAGTVRKGVRPFANVAWTTFPTAEGWMGVATSPEGLVRVVLPKPTEEQAAEELAAAFGPRTPEEALPPALRDLRDRLVAYFQGEPVAFPDPLHPALGTPFYRRVWEELRAVRRGQVVTYAELARRVGKPRAARAVGQAMARNPCPVVVPCHRVVGSDRSLVGYGGGVELKARMLAMEGVLLPL